MMLWTTVFSLINFQLTIPAGLGGAESLGSLKVYNPSFQFNHWIIHHPNCCESFEVLQTFTIIQPSSRGGTFWQHFGCHFGSVSASISGSFVAPFRTPFWDPFWGTFCNKTQAKQSVSGVWVVLKGDDLGSPFDSIPGYIFWWQFRYVSGAFLRHHLWGLAIPGSPLKLCFRTFTMIKLSRQFRLGPPFGIFSGAFWGQFQCSFRGHFWLRSGLLFGIRFGAPFALKHK